MIKKIFLFGIILFFQTSVSSGQNFQKFSPLQMKEDVDTLVKDIIETHPNPFYRYPKKKFLQDVDSIKMSFVKDLNLIAFYLRVERLMAKLQDGHTDLEIPLIIYNTTNPLILPYIFNLSATEPFITCERPYRTIKEQLPKKAEIISINDIPAEKIVNDIIELNTGESRLYRAEYGNYYFENFYLEVLYKMNGNYKIKYKNKGVVKTIHIMGIRLKELNERQKKFYDTTTNKSTSWETNYSLKLIENKTAIINFGSFDWHGFTRFTDSAFRTIKEKGIKNLIINLMDDGGGDSNVGDAFFQFILDKPFKQYDKVVGKNSALLKERLREHLVNKKTDSSDLALLARKNGSIDTVFYDDTPIQKNPLRFFGKIYLLVNGRTFSSAADFAQCFNYYKRGVIIGEETGGLIKSYGDIVTTHLPHTKLKLTISTKLYFNVGAKENDWHGVIPDIIVPTDDALSKALEVIKRTKE